MSASLQEQLQETLGAAYRIERELPGAGMSRVSGGTPTALVRFTDSSRQFYRPALASDGRNFYFTIGSRESDVWVMELSEMSH